MININISEGVKERELTTEEEVTVIGTVSTGNRVVYFQVGDEQKYNNYQSQVVALQQYYVNEINSMLDNCFV